MLNESRGSWKIIAKILFHSSLDSEDDLESRQRCRFTVTEQIACLLQLKVAASRKAAQACGVDRGRSQHTLPLFVMDLLASDTSVPVKLRIGLLVGTPKPG